ncbi:hypothetical protein BV898_13772 [Hypsibius exemplaris]|uniref:Uncharacterized protein n=1 Tax=Hypsibius exemplaris TaxID=2072580 RepID=A0A1W0W9Y6_HYPEX|nr:hypothetical protein BV898_13772 [Hypsibius exemplaris]
MSVIGHLNNNRKIVTLRNWRKKILTAAGKRTRTALAKNYLADTEAAVMDKTITRTDELPIPQPAVRATAADPVDTATSTTARPESIPSDATPTNSTNNTQMLVQYTPFPAQSSGGGFPGSFVRGGSPACLDLSGPSYLPSTSARFDSHANNYIVGENQIQHPYLMSHYTSPPTQHYDPATPYTSASLPNPNDPSEEMKLVLERDPKHVKVEKKDSVLISRTVTTNLKETTIGGRKEFRTIVTEYLQECRKKKKPLKKL